jgi:hypothetical protein
MPEPQPRSAALWRRRALLALGAWSVLPTRASAATPPPEVAADWPAARLQGQGPLRVWGLHICDLRLWTAAPALGPDNWARTPLALEIEYARALSGQRIAERSLAEMRRGGPIDATTAERWLAEMARLFPDVRAGDRITGHHRPGEGPRFTHNGRDRGELRDAPFGPRFFGIWLAPTTSEPTLRSALLGSA